MHPVTTIGPASCPADQSAKWRQYLTSRSSGSAIDAALKQAFQAALGGEISEDLAFELAELAQSRRKVVAVQDKASGPAKFGTTLPRALPLSIEERRAAAAARKDRCDELIRLLPPLTAHLIPAQQTIRSVLHAVLFLSVRDRQRCDASIATIASYAACSRSAVNQALRKLSELGLIAIQSGKSSGMCSLITPSAVFSRAREHFSKRLKAVLRRFSGGVQKVSQKTDSFFSKKFRGVKVSAPRAELSHEAVAFPVDGSIYYSRWRDLIRQHVRGTAPDCDLLANKFRGWANSKQIRLSSPTIEKIFVSWLQKYKN